MQIKSLQLPHDYIKNNKLLDTVVGGVECGGGVNVQTQAL